MTGSPSVEFFPDRTHLFVGGILLLSAIIAIGWAPTLLFWLPILPLLFIWWAWRSKTTVDEHGISARYAFRSSKHMDWADVSGIGFKGASAFVYHKDESNFKLPGVTFNSLPDLEKASRGRIPDALTQGLESIDGKVSVVHHDGEQVLMDKQQYEDYMETKNTAERVQAELRRRNMLDDEGTDK